MATIAAPRTSIPHSKSLKSEIPFSTPETFHDCRKGVEKAGEIEDDKPQA
jgi:hypothetical protein